MASAKMSDFVCNVVWKVYSVGKVPVVAADKYAISPRITCHIAEVVIAVSDLN